MMMRDKTTKKTHKSSINFDDQDDQGSDDQLEEMTTTTITTEEKKQKRFTATTGRRAAGGGSGGGGGGGGVTSCQAEKCTADLTEAKRYHRRHKVCEFHAKAPSVLVSGLRQRFCQQCSRFHELSEFDETKRSCRRRLAGHNERRRKNSEPQGEGGSSSQTKVSNPPLRPGDHERANSTQMSYPGNNGTSSYKQFQIR